MKDIFRIIENICWMKIYYVTWDVVTIKTSSETFGAIPNPFSQASEDAIFESNYKLNDI